MSVDNDEIFTIAICNKAKTFKEFSFCYGIEEGDVVTFDRDPNSCSFVSFTVLRNGIQCGVLCP